MKAKHTKNDWPFADSENFAVFTTKQVFHLNQPILYVSHDEEDGAWEFYTGSAELLESDVMVVALSEMVMHDSSIRELADLPCGWFAERGSVDSAWKRAKRT